MTARKRPKAKETNPSADPTSLDAPLAPATAGAEGDGFPIVGIGASAGGLAAFEAFFSGTPRDADPGMAFVLVQHLAPDHRASSPSSSGATRA